MTDLDKITASYVPPPPPAAGKIVVKAPKDNRGYPVFPNLHLTPDQALELYTALEDVLAELFPTTLGAPDA